MIVLDEHVSLPTVKASDSLVATVMELIERGRQKVVAEGLK